MRLAPIFQDHAVLQRDQPIPVWGEALPNAPITVRIGERSTVGFANPDGRWLVRVAPLPAGGPYDLHVQGGQETVVVRDVLIGDVWICSGQSNMEWKASMVADAHRGELPELPRIRLLTVATPARYGRQTAIDGKWAAANSDTLLAFSAVGSWFGRALHAELKVPIGLICTAWGGTRVQAWISREGLMQDASGCDEIRDYECMIHDPLRIPAQGFASYEDWEQRGAPKDAGNAGLAKGWTAPNFADQSWRTMTLPTQWQAKGHPGSGVFWFRRVINVPKAWVGRDLDLHLGAIDKHDDTWVNGVHVGAMSWERSDAWCTPREYRIPASLVAADGRVVIAVRVRSHCYHGGLIGPAEKMQIFIADTKTDGVPLAGNWQYEIEQDWGIVVPPNAQWSPGNPNTPYTLFDSRVAPLIPYAIRGAIWYQGESNADEAALYRRQMPLMIRDWRRAWGQGDFPFIQVQLANYMTVKGQPARSAWAELREAQLIATQVEPAVGMAVAIDVGDALDIHPHDKKTVGERLACWALAEVYHRGGMASGPIFASVTNESDSCLRVRFTQAKGLTTKHGGPVRQVAIAERNSSFVWAEARIEGDTLVVWHSSVRNPVAVRYAWADNPEGCNLVNAAGLPASPFRSDDWPA